MSISYTELKPFVLRKFAQNRGYDPIKWSLDDLPKWLKNDMIQLRVAPTKHEYGKIKFEKMCLSVILQAQQFVDWLKGNYVIPYDDEEIVPSTHWAYYDYKPAADNFTEEFTDALSFDNLGIKGKFNDETIWIGSPGAYTPCHYDSYGYNLHLQLKGTKRWILFPPETQLSPSRVPYEESTIYSMCDIISGQLPSTGPQQAYCVYLEEGDLLFVPPKWWHSVQCFKGDDSSGVVFSVNKWFPIESDAEEKKKECLVGCLASLMSSETEDEDQEEKNKDEELINLDSFISGVFQTQLFEEEPVIKKPRIEEDDTEFGEKQMMKFYNQYLSVAEQILPLSFDELKIEISSKLFEKSDKTNSVTVIEDESAPIILPPELNELPYTLNIRKLINAFSHESALQHVKKLMENDI